MRAAAIWGLTLGLLGAVSPVRAAPPDPIPESAPLPAYDQPLPSYDEAPIAPHVLVAPPEPPTGLGRTAVGSILFVGGAALMGFSAAKMAQEAKRPIPEDSTDHYAVLFWVPFLLVGNAAAATGAILVGTGIPAHRKYRQWAREQVDKPVPPRGDGMLGAGLTLVVPGIVVGTSVVVVERADGDRDYSTPAQVMLSASAVSVFVGGALVVGAAVLRRPYNRWHEARMVPSFSLLPNARRGVGGLSLGFAGRF